MLPLPMSRPPPRPASGSARATPAATVTELITSHWIGVRVEEAEATATHEPDGQLAVVHACVHLGVLLPVDVIVELIRIHEPTPAPRADRVVARLWSVHSYRNGSYAYEATIPGEEVGEPGRLMIRVSPGDQHGLSTVLAPVTGPVTPMAASDPSRAAPG